MDEKLLVVYCSSSFDINPKFNQAAREFVRAACLSGYGIVSGGAIKGTMKIVADEAAACGATNIGVIPRFMKGVEHPNMTKLLWTDTMAERKELMREGTCMAVALPGGIGTLDEIAETFCLAKLGIYKGKVVALNLDGFYDPFKAQLNKYVECGMLTEEARNIARFPETVEELVDILKNNG